MKKFHFLFGLFLLSSMSMVSATPTLGPEFGIILSLFVIVPLLPFFILSLIGSRYFYKRKKPLSTVMQILKWVCYVVFIISGIILALAFLYFAWLVLGLLYGKLRS